MTGTASGQGSRGYKHANTNLALVVLVVEESEESFVIEESEESMVG